MVITPAYIHITKYLSYPVLLPCRWCSPPQIAHTSLPTVAYLLAVPGVSHGREPFTEITADTSFLNLWSFEKCSTTTLWQDSRLFSLNSSRFYATCPSRRSILFRMKQHLCAISGKINFSSLRTSKPIRSKASVVFNQENGFAFLQHPYFPADLISYVAEYELCFSAGQNSGVVSFTIAARLQRPSQNLQMFLVHVKKHGTYQWNAFPHKPPTIIRK